MKIGGPTVLFHGALASATATFIAHYPWFTVYNYLHGALPAYKDNLPMRLARNAGIGFAASLVSGACAATLVGGGRSALPEPFRQDALPLPHRPYPAPPPPHPRPRPLPPDTISNSVRVVKVYKQASAHSITYAHAVREILKVDGFRGLFFRGLGTKLISNGLQGMMFSVLWRMGQDYYAKVTGEYFNGIMVFLSLFSRFIPRRPPTLTFFSAPPFYPPT